jgi:MFS family permease
MHQKPHGYRRNMVLLVGNYVTFGLGLALFSSNTVVPVFLQRLTDSQPLIGFVSAIFPLGWMLPQLFAARWVAGMARRKPALVYLSLAAPLLFAILAGVMFVTPLDRAQILLGVFIVDMALLGLLDGVIAVPWLDFIGKAIPGYLRGRMMGIQEVLYAVAAVGAGVLIAFLLSDAAPAFPRNFAYLAMASSVSFFVALLFFVPLVEPDAPATTSVVRSAWSEYLPALGRILRADRPFVMMITIRILGAFTGMALPFYVLYATTELGAPASTVGYYLSAQMIGSAVGSLLLGHIYDLKGSRRVIRIVVAVSLVAPLAALVIPLIGLSGAALQWTFILVFFTLSIGGAGPAAVFIGYTNFIIDHSAPQDRPLYLGLSNTLAGPTALAATLGGFLLQHTSYPTLFLATFGILCVAQVLAWRLPEPRQRRDVESDAGSGE